MSLSVLLSIAWAFAATATAMLPMRRQFLPGLCLLIAAPFLIVFLGLQHGAFWSIVALAAFASMFRRPLIHLFQRAIGQAPPWRPGEEDI